MINKREKNRLKKILGNRYSKAVLVELNKMGCFNKNGKPHSLDFIRIVFNGDREHQDVETAIYKAAETAIDNKSKEKAKRERILKSA